MKTLFPCLCLFILAASQPLSAAETFDHLWRFLADEQLISDTNDISRAVGEALLKSIDPKARLLSPEEADTFKRSLKAPGSEGDPSATSSSGDNHGRLGTYTLLRAEELPEEIGYLRVQGLYEESAGVINARLEEWSLKGLPSVVIDLRAAEGTHLEAIVGIMANYVPKETELYSVVNAAGENVETISTSQTTRYGLQTVVLIDRFTTGASRALAGVMKARKTALLIGQAAPADNRVRSFISLQETDIEADDLVLYIGNRFVQTAGAPGAAVNKLLPDIHVDPKESPRKIDVDERPADEQLAEEIERDRQLSERVDWDPELRRAVDYLLGLKALGLRGADER